MRGIGARLRFCLACRRRRRWRRRALHVPTASQVLARQTIAAMQGLGARPRFCLACTGGWSLRRGLRRSQRLDIRPLTLLLALLERHRTAEERMARLTLLLALLLFLRRLCGQGPCHVRQRQARRQCLHCTSVTL